MASLNKVTLIGNLGRDPELRYTKTQTPFAKFSIATSESFVTNGEKREKTEWHNIVVWGKQAEIANQYLRKGRQVYIAGKIEYREYEDQNGQKRYITDIRADRFLMLGSPPGQGGHGGQGGYGGQPFEPQQPQQPQNYGAPSNYGAPIGGGGTAQQQPQQQQPQRPATYGGAPSAPDIPESDDFSDEDIPF